MSKDERGEAQRLESLWQGTFGDEYTVRNAAAGERRGAFWQALVAKHAVRRVLEVGCNVGGNLRHLAALLPPREVWGVDLNEGALARLRAAAPGVNACWSPARSLPFRDGSFDLVFTAGVLIHQPQELLPLVMAEVVRCSRRLVLAAEYHAEELTEVPYRGQTGALFKRDFGALYRALFPDLRLLEQGRLGPEAGWDDVTFWLFERGA